MNRISRWILVFGLVAVAFYVAHVVIGGALWHGYRQASQAISDLTATGAPNRGLLLVLTSIYGLCTVAFSILLLIRFTQKNQGEHRTEGRTMLKTGLILMVILFSVSSLYAFAPEDLPGRVVTLGGILHIAITAVIAPLSIVGPIFIGIGMRRLDGYIGIGFYSILTGGLITAFGLMSVGAAVSGNPYFGVYERLNIGSLLVWIIAMAVAVNFGGSGVRKRP